MIKPFISSEQIVLDWDFLKDKIENKQQVIHRKLRDASEAYPLDPLKAQFLVFNDLLKLRHFGLNLALSLYQKH